jgi:hypothetical protein
LSPVQDDNGVFFKSKNDNSEVVPILPDNGDANGAYNIARKGFTGGTPEVEDIAYTNAGREKHSAGYDFAFLINDRSVDFNGYGDEAVIFRASGVLLLHYGDEQRQVVFWGPSVKEMISIEST